MLELKAKIAVRRIVLCIAVVATLAFIWSNSLADTPASTERSNTVIRLLKPIVDPHGRLGAKLLTMFVRKAAHFTEFAILGVELFLLFGTFERIGASVRAALLLPVVSCLFCAVTDECIQLFSAGRACRLTDVLIDLSGSVFGILVTVLIGYAAKKVRLAVGSAEGQK